MCMNKKWGVCLVLMVLISTGAYVGRSCVDAYPPQPVGVVGQVWYNGVLVGSGVFVTVRWVEGDEYNNASTNNGNYAVAFAGMDDGDTIQVNVSYMRKNVFNTTIVDTSVMANWCNISIQPSGDGTKPVVVIPSLYSGFEGDVVVFDASASYDPDGEIVSYSWSFYGDGNPYTLTGKTVSKKWMDEIDCLVYLTVTDNDGYSTTAMGEIEIANKAPYAVVDGPDACDVGDTVSLTAEGSSDAGNDVLGFQWDVDGDGVWDGQYDGKETISVTYSFPGTYNVTVKVSDGDGGVDTAVHVIVVSDEGNNGGGNSEENQKPLVNFTVSGERNSDGSYIYGVSLVLSSTSYDPDGDIVNWTWNMAGLVKYGENTSYMLDGYGNRTIRLTVKDNNGSSNYTIREITIAKEGGKSTLTIVFPSDDITYVVKDKTTNDIVHSGGGSTVDEITGLNDGEYILYCERGERQWMEELTIHGHTTHSVSIPSGGGGLPFPGMLYMIAALGVTTILWRKKCR